MQTSGEDAITSWGELAQEARKLATVVGPLPAAAAPRKGGVLEMVKSWGKCA